MASLRFTLHEGISFLSPEIILWLPEILRDPQVPDSQQLLTGIPAVPYFGSNWSLEQQQLTTVCTGAVHRGLKILLEGSRQTLNPFLYLAQNLTYHLNAYVVPEKSLTPGTSYAFWAGSHKNKCFTSKLCFLLLPQGLFKRQDHTFFKWNSSQAEVSSWAQPLTGWKTFLNAMKQMLAGSGKWFLCMKWTVEEEKEYSPFVVFSTTARFSFCDHVFLPLLI